LSLVPAQGEVLDVAAGPGSLSLLAAKTAHRVHAVDFAPAMLDQLRERANTAGIHNIEAALGDGHALSFEDERFDAVYSMFALMVSSDRPRGINELYRVVRRGARAVTATWPNSDRVPLFAALFAAMKAEMPGSGIGDAPAVLGTPDEIRIELGAAGFSKVDVEEHTFVDGSVTAAEIWHSFSRGGAPAVLMRRKMGDQAFEDLSARIVRRLEADLGTDPVEMRLTALFGVGTR
jgi:SAM-dependent methyltransferase